MAAPQIPNLNTLRNARGGGRGRGRGSGSSSNAYKSSPVEEKLAKDKIVQQTDHDASVSRMSAVELGYLDDPFAKYFVSGGAGQRRFPIINRGTYVRTKAIDNLVESFVDNETSQRKQIISLGAGSDTRFFRLMSRHPRANGIGHDHPNLIYHEFDFPQNTREKLKPIKCTSELCVHVESPVSFHNTSISPDIYVDDTLIAQNYHVHALDIRELDPSRPDSRSFPTIDRDLPTLIISECCLVYLAPAVADTVVRYFTQHLFPASTPLGLVLYEPINPHDAFGKVMESNLAARGIVLQTLRKYGSLESQAARMKAYGFEGSGGADINTLWEKGVEEKEKERVAGLEMVDEVEEWELLAGHYCVCWGWRGDGVWDGWREAAERTKTADGESSASKSM